MNERRIVVIGGGPGGYVAAIRAAQLGARVTLIEKNSIGGTCLNRGCIPTKSLLHDSGMLQKIKHSSVFNPLLNQSFHPFEAMMKRKEKVVRNIVNGVEFLLNSFQIEVENAEARLMNSRQLLINRADGNSETITADQIIVATGSKISTPNNLSPDGDLIITSDDALNLASLPKHVVIVGGGYIGIEFATFFKALGVDVTIVEIMETILSGLDDELIQNTRRFLEQRGIKIHTGTVVTSYQKTANGITIKAESAKSKIDISADKLLISTGRVPNLDIDLTKAGIEFSAKGIAVNRNMETSAQGVFAVGDVIGGIQLAHVAMEEGEIAAENAMGMQKETTDRPVPFCVFTRPEIASIGLSEREARIKGPVSVGRFPLRANATAMIHEETDGFIKVVVNRESNKILGIHILGHEASAMLSTASSLLYQDMDAEDFSGFIQAHPTTPEALKEAFLAVHKRAIHAPKPFTAKT